MTDQTGKTPAEIAWNRLSACFSPPEVADVKAFRSEFLGALNGFGSEVLVDAVSQIIRTRKHRTFPSIGDVTDACMGQIPSVPQRPQMVTDAYAVQDAKRREGIVALAAMPGIDRIVAAEAHTAGLDFYVENGRLPTRDEWADLKAVVARANALMAEADGVPEGKSSTWVHITQSAAGALRYRRAKVAEEIAKLRMKEAAE